VNEDPIAVLLKFGFLAVLYLFLLFVARSAGRDLRRTEERAAPEAPAAGVVDDEAAGGLRPGVRPRLVVVAAMGKEPGTMFELSDSATLGRGDNSDIRIDDPYASSSHARIFPRGQFMYIEDMGSTNGTLLNGRPLRRPEQLKVTDTVRIGDSEYRYEE
jgi:pSer/pThr/pTyr-binding forkhead associated (FHA) protein